MRTADLSPADLHALITESAEAKRHPYARRDLLRGDVVVIYMARPSTRTRLSFDAAIHRLGGDAVVVGPQDLQLGRGETIEDTARAMSCYARAIVIRTSSDDDLQRFAEASSVPVINALTDVHHPCQSLADIFTLREHLGDLPGRRIAYVGDGNNVANSLIEAAALAGLSLAVATPPAFAPDPGVLDEARAIARQTGATIEFGHDPQAAVRNAEAVYTDTWFSMGGDELEHDVRERALRPFQVNETLMSLARPGAAFMHCLPAHRGEEVTDDVIDGPRSLVWQQAANRMYTEQALLVALIADRIEGRRFVAAWR